MHSFSRKQGLICKCDLNTRECCLPILVSGVLPFLFRFAFNFVSEGVAIGVAFGVAISNDSIQPNSTFDDPFTSVWYIYQFMFFVLAVYVT